MTAVSTVSCIIFGAQDLDHYLLEDDENENENENEISEDLMIVNVDSFTDVIVSMQDCGIVVELHELWQKILKLYVRDPSGVGNNALRVCDTLWNLVEKHN